MPSQPIDRLTISEAPLGPIVPCSVTVRPFTVFIGEQGTGKSLLSQILYFFDNLPYLVHYTRSALGAERQRGKLASEEIIRMTLYNLRSREKHLATLADPVTTLRCGTTGHVRTGGAWSLSMGLSHDPVELGGTPIKGVRRIVYRPNRSLAAFVAATLKSPPAPPSALFVPAERILYSQASGPSTFRLLSLPSTLVLFADAMEQVGRLVQDWRHGRPDTDEGQWVRDMARAALGGEAYRRDDDWRWRFHQGRSTRDLSIDMASSGQRANWPLLLLAQVLFRWRQENKIAEHYTLYVEEPEIHLHPAAQVSMVKILAFLVNHGFRVVVTTHSLNVLYALNNLVLAGGLGQGVVRGVSEPEVRMRSEQVAAYALHTDGSIRDIVERTTGFLSEVELGRVAAALGDEMNLISMLRQRQG